MKKNLLFALVVFLVPSFASAHVSVRSRESKPGAEERYTVRVPTEGAVATTHVRLEIPTGVEVLEVMPADGATFETEKAGKRVTSITWKKEIAPKQAAEFVFRVAIPRQDRSCGRRISTSRMAPLPTGLDLPAIDGRLP